MRVERRVRKLGKCEERKRSKERDEIWRRKNENERNGERVKKKKEAYKTDWKRWKEEKGRVRREKKV